jgi:hypothetical protein
MRYVYTSSRAGSCARLDTARKWDRDTQQSIVTRLKILLNHRLHSSRHGREIIFCFLLCPSAYLSTHFNKTFKSSRSSTSLTRAAKSSSPLASAWFLKYSILSLSQFPSSPACVAALCVSIVMRLWTSSKDGYTHPRYRDTVLSCCNHRMEHNKQQLLSVSLRCGVIISLALSLVLSLCDLCLRLASCFSSSSRADIPSPRSRCSTTHSPASRPMHRSRPLFACRSCAPWRRCGLWHSHERCRPCNNSHRWRLRK